MRTMSQLIMLDADDGYLITVPEGQNAKIEIGLIKAKLPKECRRSRGGEITTHATLDEFIKPTTFSEIADTALQEKYRDLFRGRWNGNGEWRITRIQIKPRRISIDVESISSSLTEVFEIKPIRPESYLKFAIKAPNRDGKVEIYTIEMSVHKCSGGYNHFMKVTEPEDSNGVCDIVLENGSLLKSVQQYTGDDWIPAYAINRR